MKRIFLFVIVFWSFLGYAKAAEDWSDKPIIDEQFKQVETEMDNATNNCMKKEKNVIKKMKCAEALREEYRKQGNLRGTNEYCKKHYAHLPKQELIKVWNNLKTQRRRARISPSSKIAGEVTEGDYMVEEFWVESRLSEIRNERIHKNAESLGLGKT